MTAMSTPAASYVARLPRGRLTYVETSSLSDEQLLEEVARRRDGHAFEALYGRYARAVYSLVMRMLGDRAASEDVVQEAFAAVWRAAAGYRPERGSAVAWMFTIARNAAADSARTRSRTSYGDPPEREDPSPLPDDRAISDLEAFRVHAAVDSLPPREREVIELAYFEGLSQSEIAERLVVPLGTVKTRTRAALARLASRLEPERVKT
jgi:RNA polymerase sigma-70 factor (ECF subfamily)